MARTTKAKATSKASAWKFTIGLKPHTLTAFERTDKGNTVWLRWNRAGTGLYDKMSLGYRIRNEETGRLHEDMVAQAQAAAKVAYHRLLKGEDPRTPEPAQAHEDTPLTIAAGLELALRVPEGMYAVENEHVVDMRRYGRQLLAHLPSGLTTWEQITPVSYQQLWRNLATWRAAEAGKGAELRGRRATELAVVLLAQAGRWLKRAGKLKIMPEEPQERWEDALCADWARITKAPAVAADPPRHTPEELGRLLAAAEQGLGDPRIRLAFRTFGEARLGQGLACDRAALDLSTIGSHGLGRFTIPDCGRKKGVTIDLTPELRAAWDYELAKGYLRHLEAAYQAGQRRTYPLFPGGRLARPVALSRRPERNGEYVELPDNELRAKPDVTVSIGDRAARDHFHELERLAGVATIRGRGWYGVRRVAADLAEDVESDGRALNAITGHTSDETRRQIYQQKKRDKVLATATRARTAARDLAKAAAEAERLAFNEGAATKPNALASWERVKEAKRERRRAAHPEPKRPRDPSMAALSPKAKREYRATRGATQPGFTATAVTTVPTPEPTPRPTNKGETS